MIDQPFRKVLQKPETSRRLIKWSMELGEFDIHFKPKTALKSQIICYFIVESVSPIEEEEVAEGAITLLELWSLHMDGSSSKQGSGAGIILTSPNGWVLEYALRFEFIATNNAAEYEALIFGLKLARHLRVTKLLVYTDSQLVASQVQGIFKAKDAVMISYLGEVSKLAVMISYLGEVSKLQDEFIYLEVTQIPRDQNAKADALSKLATEENLELYQTVFLEAFPGPSISETWVVNSVEVEPSWTNPLLAWMKDS
ncbi:RVT_3 domain-containing protein [Cephalotus follicularis]|uniref:RVT_3 domain-containing protein n=1 Tax=Cephalotus follicularis TaxID=3775 RepID=A0A1Q3CJ33_CEPFO|nr:RVT_3 domain-containing protein [Cephalotus follicularis]